MVTKRPIDMIRAQSVRLKIERADGTSIVLEDDVIRLHGDWLWDLFQVPPEKRGPVLEITVKAEALEPGPRIDQR